MTAPLNILIIDDNPDDLEFYSDLLARCQKEYRVTTAETAADGLELIKQQTYDCTFIDFNIPDMDGVEILKNMRQYSASVPATIMWTGEPHQKIQAEAAREGALNYIVKDAYMSPEELEEAVTQVIDWAQQLNESGQVECR